MQWYAKNNNENKRDLYKISSDYIGAIICLIGLIGNVLSIVVWRKINKKRSDSGKSAGVLLIILAFADSGLLVMFFCTETITKLHSDIEKNVYFVTFYSYFGFPMFFYFICSSIWMIVCVSVNRFVAVVYPLKVRKFNSLRVTYFIGFITQLFAFIINIPHFFNYHPEKSNITEWKYSLTYYGSSDKAFYYDFWVHCIFLVLAPWITIFCLNSVIIFRLLTKPNFVTNKKSKSNREKQTTVILLTVTVSFLIFLLWQCLTQCFYMQWNRNKHSSDVEKAFDFAKLGVVINSSMNFVLYCISGTMFRNEFLKIFINLSQKGYNTLDSSNSSKSDSVLTTNSSIDDVKALIKDAPNENEEYNHTI
ncbi:probable G-protein coupled receptor 139 [Hydra vulgaris]|uniref:probable G-protein coupled receptor 139 n=1 Tax=Hydra vulgaris TaxID=6087 RepID=UPI001F5FDCBE|nr:probable G-protein coupled receptor 139 isoform X1 [Hydra vulgaris]